MRCIDKKKRLLSVILIIVVLSVGCISKKDKLVTKYETENYNQYLYEGELFASQLCVSDTNISLNDFKPDSTLHAGALFGMNQQKVFYSEQIHDRLFPASTTKILTLYVALKYGTLSDTVTISENAVSVPSDSSIAGLRAGEQLTLEDLLYGLMLPSGNDSAVAIAEHISGNVDAFVKLMNQEANILGATNSHFVNPHGYHDENHYTTARDMAKIMVAAIQNETFCTLFSATSHEVPATNLSEARQMFTTNYLISDYLNQNYYDTRVIGGKTGFTTPAGRCLATLSESNGMKMVIVIMGAEAEFAEDGYTPLSYGHFEETIDLMNFVYDKFMPAQVLSANQILEQFPVNGGVTDTQGYTQNPRSTLLPVGSDMNALRYEIELDNGGISAPVKAGDPIGVARVWNQSKCVAQEQLYSSVDVAQEIVGENSSKPVNPAALINEASSRWHIWLIVILAVLGVLVLVIVIMHIRNSIIRARRKKRRAMRRRRR